MIKRLIALGLLVLMLVALFFGGAQPQAVNLVPAPWDKLAHITFFFMLTVLLIRYLSLSVVFGICLVLVVGVTDEVHQIFLPGRMAGWDDWLADLVGTGLGWCISVSKRERKLCQI